MQVKILKDKNKILEKFGKKIKENFLKKLKLSTGRKTRAKMNSRKI